jgi:DNA-nicking Smr family endonuclease
MGKRSKPDDPQGFNRPFECLAGLLPRRGSRREALTPVPQASVPAGPPAETDAELFARATAGARPIDWNCPAGSPPRRLPEKQSDEESIEVARLRALVERGEGFVVSDTPEYMEGVGCPAPPHIAARLHRGEFSVQGHIDLHGLTVNAARDALDAFLRESIEAGKRTVLVIHGRGLSSPADPVLKTKVAEWLCSNRWRRWVVAFTSARMCDGGSGASYVLLRRRPLARGLRSRRQKNS